MKKLILNIFDKLRFECAYTRKAEETITKEILQILTPLKTRLNQEDYEYVRDLVFGAALVSEREGFVIGIQFIFMLLNEIGND